MTIHQARIGNHHQPNPEMTVIATAENGQQRRLLS